MNKIDQFQTRNKSLDEISELNSLLLNDIENIINTVYNDYLVFKELLALPIFINKKEMFELNRVSQIAMSLQKKIFKKYFQDNSKKIKDFYQLTDEYFDECIVHGLNKLDHIIGRADLVKTKDGYKCLEFNITSYIGGLTYSPFIHQYYQSPILKDFFIKHAKRFEPVNISEMLFRHLILECRKLKSLNEKLNIVIITNENLGSEEELTLFLNHIISSLGLNMVGAVYRTENATEISCSKDIVTFNGQIIHGILDRGNQLSKEIYVANKNNTVHIFNSPVGELIGNKKTLALLSQYENSDFFDAEEQSNIKKYIPWSRIIKKTETDYCGEKIDLIKYLIENKNKFVLKGVAGTRGEAVFIGHETDQGKWDTILKRVIDQHNWVVQEYHESIAFPQISDDTGLQDHRIIWGVFSFGNEYSGCFLSAGKMINSSLVNTSKEKIKIGLVIEEK
jgi:hypothetical protein